MDHDEEQLVALKQWWAHYGSTIMVGIILALLILLGWRYWNQHQISVREEASGHYQTAINAFRELQSAPAAAVTATLRKRFTEEANILLDNYKNTPYAALSGLLLAKDALSQNNPAEAVNSLQWVIDKSADPLLSQLARVRLARVYVMQNKPDDALALVEQASAKGKEYAAEFAEVKGDALVAKNQMQEAKTSYETALTLLSEEQQQVRGLLHMKIDTLPVVQDDKTSEPKPSKGEAA